MLFRCAPNVDEVPGCAFEQYVDRTPAACTGFSRLHFTRLHLKTSGIQHLFGCIVHLALRTTHHACNGQWTVLVTHEHVRGSESSLDAVKCGEFLPIFRGACDDPDISLTGALFEPIIIKRVQWLTEIEHGIVGRVHNVIDGANPCKAQ